MSLQLYFGPGACSFVPHSLLELSGAEYEAKLIKLHKGEQLSEEYKALNPRGQVPVLVDDGTVITQIMAIVLHLDAKFPDAHFLPAGGMERTRALSTLAWMNNTVHPAFTHIFMPQKFTGDEAAQQAVKAQAMSAYPGLMAEIDALAAKASPWVGGEHPGALDAYTLVLMRWGGLVGMDTSPFKAACDIARRFAALPAVSRAVERERLQLDMLKG
ncbi:glutathione S-transferase family protein [Hydrogenophaga sp. 5NK40-0174]|uniref:glutathione S-transferase family protein n=1 Tax=Hydrogenophaga sp. 5NK40-0174 TaxID=3127649 RepID=UPI00310B47BC